MNILQGFRTIIFNGVAIIATWLGTNHGVELSQEHQTAITTTIIAAVNIGLRMVTKTPIGKKKK